MTSNSNEENSRQRQSVPDNDPFLLPPLWVTRLHCRQKRSSQHTQKRKKSETEDHFILTSLPARTTGVFQAIERKRGGKKEKKRGKKGHFSLPESYAEKLRDEELSGIQRVLLNANEKPGEEKQPPSPPPSRNVRKASRRCPFICPTETPRG